MIKTTYIIIKVHFKEDEVDIDDIILNTELILPIEVIDYEIVGSSDDIVFD